MNRILGSKKHCDAPVILFTGLESQPSSKITYRSAEVATVTGPNNVKSLYKKPPLQGALEKWINSAPIRKSYVGFCHEKKNLIKR